MNHIKTIVSSIISSNMPSQGWKTSILQHWPEIIGNLSSKVFIEKIHQDTIVLAVTDSCWMQELHLLADVIKQKINAKIGTDGIKTIRFKYSSKKTMRIQNVINRVPLSHTISKITDQQQQALNKINDPELSQALIGLLQKCHQSS